MVFVAGVVVMYGAVNVWAVSPDAIEEDALNAALTQTQTQINTLNTHIALTMQAPVHDPNTEYQQEVASVSTMITQQQAALTTQEHTLLTADQMGNLLDGLLRQSAGVHLVRMKTLPASSLLVKDKDGNTRLLSEQEAARAAPDVQTLIYRHSIQMTIAGAYFDLLHYVESMEKLPQRLLWKQVSMVSKDYPQNELTLEVYTLGLDNTWLNL